MLKIVIFLGGCYTWIHLFPSVFCLSCRLVGNPICTAAGATQKFCFIEKQNNSFISLSNCGGKSCLRDEALSPNCQCSHPYTGTLNFFSFSFTDFGNSTYYNVLHGSIMSVLLAYGLPVDSVILSNPSININSYLEISLQLFPSGQDSFNRTSVSTIGFLLNRQPFEIKYFGPFFFIDEPYCCFPGNFNYGHKRKHLRILVIFSLW